MPRKKRTPAEKLASLQRQHRALLAYIRTQESHARLETGLPDSLASTHSAEAARAMDEVAALDKRIAHLRARAGK